MVQPEPEANDAFPDNQPNATSSYSWYMDSDGKVKSMLYINPLKKECQDIYP